MEIMKHGMWTEGLKSGISDLRVTALRGADYLQLQGHVIAAVGGRQVLVRSTEPMQTCYRYLKRSVA